MSRDGGEAWELTGLGDVSVYSLATNSVGHLFAGTALSVYSWNRWEGMI